MSLIEITRKTLDLMWSHPSWRILIVDGFTSKILSLVYSLDEILSKNISCVEGIGYNPTGDALYFIHPSSVGSLRGPSIYLYSTGNIPIERLGPVRKSIKAFVELHLDYIPLDPLTFSLQGPDMSLFNPVSNSHFSYGLESLSKRIASFMVSLGQVPCIRHHTLPTAFSTASDSLSFKLATLVQKQIDLFKTQNVFETSPYSPPILIICDRTIDVLAPLLHEFSYEAMAADLLGMKDGKILLDTKEPDMIWTQARHWHIAEVLEFLPQMLKQFSDGNEAAKYEVSGPSSKNLDQLKGVVGSMREYQSFKPVFGMHTDTCAQLMAIYNDRKIPLIESIEQDLVMTKPGSDSHLLARALQIFQDSKIHPLDKTRLAMLIVIAMEGMTDADRKSIIETAALSSSEIQSLTNLSYLNVRLSRAMEKKKSSVRNPYVNAEILKRSRDKQVKFENSRYVPLLKYVGEDAIKGSLDQSVFPFLDGHVQDTRPKTWAVDTPPEPQRKKPSWATRKPGSASVAGLSDKNMTRSGSLVDLRQNGPRIVLFVIGGITFSESRSMHELKKDHQRDIYIGSTHVWHPDGFVECLKDLHRTDSSNNFLNVVRPIHSPSTSSSRQGGEISRGLQAPARGESSRSAPQKPPPVIPPRPSESTFASTATSFFNSNPFKNLSLNASEAPQPSKKGGSWFSK